MAESPRVRGERIGMLIGFGVASTDIGTNRESVPIGRYAHANRIMELESTVSRWWMLSQLPPTQLCLTDAEGVY